VWCRRRRARAHVVRPPACSSIALTARTSSRTLACVDHLRASIKWTHDTRTEQRRHYHQRHAHDHGQHEFDLECVRFARHRKTSGHAILEEITARKQYCSECLYTAMVVSERFKHTLTLGFHTSLMYCMLASVNVVSRIDSYKRTFDSVRRCHLHLFQSELEFRSIRNQRNNDGCLSEIDCKASVTGAVDIIGFTCNRWSTVAAPCILCWPCTRHRSAP
jgi:hypothetical protein